MKVTNVNHNHSFMTRSCQVHRNAQLFRGHFLPNVYDQLLCKHFLVASDWIITWTYFCVKAKYFNSIFDEKSDYHDNNTFQNTIFSNGVFDRLKYYDTCADFDIQSLLSDFFPSFRSKSRNFEPIKITFISEFYFDSQGARKRNDKHCILMNLCFVS